MRSFVWVGFKRFEREARILNGKMVLVVVVEVREKKGLIRNGVEVGFGRRWE